MVEINKKGWSQEQLALEADLHRAYIGQIEKSEKNIGLINLEKIAKALNVTLRNLIGYVLETRTGSRTSKGAGRAKFFAALILLKHYFNFDLVKKIIPLY